MQRKRGERQPLISAVQGLLVENRTRWSVVDLAEDGPPTVDFRGKALLHLRKLSQGEV